MLISQNEIANEIEALGNELIQTYCSETGLPEARAIGERGRTIFQLNSYADACERGEWLEARIDTAIPGFGLRRKQESECCRRRPRLNAVSRQFPGWWPNDPGADVHRTWFPSKPDRPHGKDRRP